MLGKLKRKFFRNRMSITGDEVKSKRVNLEWWNKKKNLGEKINGNF